MTAELNGQAAPAAGALQITRGNPTAEDIAALTAIVSALASTDPCATVPTDSRRGRIGRRRALNGAPLPWKVGRQ